MRILAAIIVVAAAITVTLSAPSPQRKGDEQAMPKQHQRVSRQAPGMDILGQIGQVFQEHIQEKHERVMDVVDTVGKALGSIGDTVNQAISSRVASEDGGQRVGGVGQQVGQVLQTLGDKLRETMRARAEQQEDEDDDLEARLIRNPLTRDPNTRAAYEVGPEGSARCMGRGPNDMMTTTAASSMEQAMSRMLGRRRGKRSDSHHSSTSNAQGAGGMARSG